MTDEKCACGSGQDYPACCGKLHRGQADAVTAEQLMRSRYSAYVFQNTRYLLATWHPRTRPRTITPGRQVWTGLEIVGRTGGSLFESTGTVAFRAHFLDNGRPKVLSENSLFEKHDGRWVYVEAIT